MFTNRYYSVYCFVRLTCSVIALNTKCTFPIVTSQGKIVVGTTFWLKIIFNIRNYFIEYSGILFKISTNLLIQILKLISI